MLQAEASRDPQPVTRWLQAMAISGNQLRGGGARDQVKKAFGAPGGPASLCSKAVTGRYPFTAGSTNDIPLDDFAKLFAAGGLLDKFFNDNLQTFVDTSGAAWKAQPVAGVAPLRSRRAIWRSSSARRRSATCSSAAAATSRPCGSTSRRSIPTRSR